MRLKRLCAGLNAHCLTVYVLRVECECLCESELEYFPFNGITDIISQIAGTKSLWNYIYMLLPS